MHTKPIKVLLVEDNLAHARAIGEGLCANLHDRFDLTCAERLSTGLEIIARGGIDLVLLDLRLPDMSGFDVCRQLRTISIVPIIIVTAQTDTHDLVVGLEAGADDFLDDADNWEVFTTPEGFTAVNEAVKALGIEPATAKVSMIPQNYVKLEGKAAQQMVKLMEALDDHDDVQNIASNFDIEEKEIEASLA